MYLPDACVLEFLDFSRLKNCIPIGRQEPEE
jgi:hypothetical protein